MSEIKHTMPDVVYAWDCQGDIKTKATHPDFGYMPATIYTYTRTDIYATATSKLKAELERIKQSNTELVEALEIAVYMLARHKIDERPSESKKCDRMKRLLHKIDTENRQQALNKAKGLGE